MVFRRGREGALAWVFCLLCCMGDELNQIAEPRCLSRGLYGASYSVHCSCEGSMLGFSGLSSGASNLAYSFSGCMHVFYF